MDSQVPAVQNNALSTEIVMPQVQDNDFVNAGDIIISRYQIIQTVSQMASTITPGLIYDTAIQQSYPNVRVVIMAMMHQRVYWGEQQQMGKDVKPLCVSHNGYMPRPEIHNPVNVRCAGCPAAQWGADRKPPKCADTFAWLVCNYDTGAMALVSMSKSSFTCGRSIATYFKTTGKPFCAVPVELGTVKNTSGPGNYFSWTFKPSKQYDDPKKQAYFFNLYNQLHAPAWTAEEKPSDPTILPNENQVCYSILRLTFAQGVQGDEESSTNGNSARSQQSVMPDIEDNPLPPGFEAPPPDASNDLPW